MKKIHPEMITVQVSCSGCGNKFTLVGAYYSNSLIVEQCNKCHSAYTGERRMVSTGAVEKFNLKFGDFTTPQKKKS